jgi:hypothetical protein
MLLHFLPSLSPLIWYLLLNFQICHQSISSITICLWQFFWDQLGWVQKLMGVLHYPLQQISVAVRTQNYVKNPSNSFFNQYPQKNRIVWRQWKILFLAGWSADVYLFSIRGIWRILLILDLNLCLCWIWMCTLQIEIVAVLCYQLFTASYFPWHLYPMMLNRAVELVAFICSRGYIPSLVPIQSFIIVKFLGFQL